MSLPKEDKSSLPIECASHTEDLKHEQGCRRRHGSKSTTLMYSEAVMWCVEMETPYSGGAIPALLNSAIVFGLQESGTM